MGKKLSAYNLYMRKALKGKLAGKTKAQRKAIFKAAARGWNKGKPKSRPRSKPKSGGSSRSSSTTGGRRMGKGFNTQKLYASMRLIALGLPAAGIIMTNETLPTKITKLSRAYFGWDNNKHTWDWRLMAEGWGPRIGAEIATRVVPKIGRAIASFLRF